MTMAYVGDPEPPDLAAFREFLEKQPLYTWVELEIPFFAREAQPPTVEVHCVSCRRVQPHLQSAPELENSQPRRLRGDPSIAEGYAYCFPYRCAGCMDFLEFWVEVRLVQAGTPASRRSLWRVRKVGQRPPRSIEIAPEIEEALGDDTELYRRALLSLGQGYGIGACAYLRRILEHQVNPILSLVLESYEKEGANPAELERIRSVIDSKVAEDKMKVAYTHAPKSLIVDGENPLKLLHGLLSKGVHEYTEDEATTAALKVDGALVFVVRQLFAARADRERFTETIRRIRRPAET